MTNTTSNSGEIKTTAGAVKKIVDRAVERIPDIKYASNAISNWRWPSELCFKIEESRPCAYVKGIYSDSLFLEIFDFEIIAGDPNPLNKPDHIAISRSLATKLYGNENPVGMTYKMDNHYRKKGGV